MTAPRAQACSAILQNGSMLVVGGAGASGPVKTAEIYGPDGAFAATASMNQARTGAACATLLDGRVLVMGGDGGSGALNTAEIFDPVKQTWTLTGSLATAREGHQAIVNAWGAVWVAGGTNASGMVATLEEFDPPNNSFRTLGALQTPRTGFAMAVLPKTKFAIAGGVDAKGNPLSSVEIYDGVMGATSVAGSMSMARQSFAAAPLPNGTILMTGGLDLNGNLLNSTEIFDPVQGASTAGPNLLTPRANHFAYALPNNGAVMITGGTGSSGVLASTETYAPWTGAIQASASMSVSRRDNVAASLLPGNLLVAGGRNETGPLNSSELYRFATVATDRPDYSPGTPVKISGTGWQPGEQVFVQITAFPVDQHHIEFTGAGTADGAGNVTVSGFTVDKSHLGMKFILSATGSVSQAQISFTDLFVPTFTYTFTPPSEAVPGSNVTVLVTATGGGPAPPSGQIIPCLNNNCNVAGSTTPVTTTCNPVNGGNNQNYTLQVGTSSSTCSFTINNISAGTTAVGLEYSGDPNYNFQTPLPGGTPTQDPGNDVNYFAQTATTTTMTGGPAGSQPYGITTPYTASVTTAGSVATGQVQFLINGITSYNGGAATAPLVNVTGTAPNYTASWVPNPPLNVGGPYTITAQYNPNNADKVNASSTSTNSVITIIGAVGTATTAIYSNNPIVYGQPETITGSVAATSGGGVPSSGTVTLSGLTGVTGCNGGSLTVNVSATGTFTCLVNTPGPAVSGSPYTVTASFAGASGTGYNSSAATVGGTGATLVVNPANTTITTPAVTAASATNFTFSATAAAVSPSAATVNTGTIQFFYYSGLNAAIQTGCAGATALGSPVTVNASGTSSSGSQNLPIGNYTICATYGNGLPNFNNSTSTGLNLTSPSSPIGDTVGAPTYTPSGSVAFGQPVTITAVVTATSGTNPPLPGTLTFNDTSNGGAQIGTAQTVTQVGTTNSSTASVTVSNLTGGVHNITATFNSTNSSFANNTSVPSALTITPLTAPFTISSGPPNPVQAGSNVTVTSPATFIATYTGGASPAPQGTITFTNNGVIVCGPATLSTTNGITTATCNATAGAGGLPVGPVSVTATFNDTDGNFTQGVITPFAFTVTKAGTTDSLVATPNPSTLNQTVTLTSTVAVPGVSTIVPTGTVTFTLGGTAPPSGTNTCLNPVALTNNSGVYTATCSFQLAGPVGQISYSSTYNGDSQTATSTGTTSLTANKATPTSTLTAAVGGVTVTSETIGNIVVLTAKLGSLVSGVAPTGGFTFAQANGLNAPLNTTCLGTGTPVAVTLVAGVYQAQCSFQFAGPAGPAATYTATYSTTDPNYASTVSTDTLATGPAPTTTALTASVGGTPVTSETVGQVVTLTATVSSTVTGLNPTGTITFTLGGNVFPGTSTCGSPVAVNPATGVATCQYEFAGPGSSSFNYTATYSGDANFSTSNKTTALTTLKANTTTTLASVNNAAQATVSPSPATPGIVPTGTVTFYAGTTATGTPIASGPLTNGTYSLDLPQGPYVAVYSGDQNFNPSTSVSTSIAHVNPTTTTTVTSNLAVVSPNQTVVLTATVSGTGANGTPTGSVTFTDNGVVIGVGTVVNGQAVISTTLPVGANNIVATYSGDSTYSGSSGNLGLNVNKPATSVTVTSNLTATVYGQMVILTAKVGGSGSPSATGTVQFFDGSTLLGTGTLVNGVASLTITNLPTGVNNISVVYSGDSNYNGASGNGGLVTVNKAMIAVTLAANTTNNQETLTATVGVVAPGGGTPTGTVQFIDTVTGKVVGTATLAPNGTASITITVTTDPIMAVYSGDGNFNSANSGNAAALAIVHSAAYTYTYAPDEIVTVFGVNLASQTVTAQLPLPTILGAISVTVTDSANVTRQAAIFYVSPTQFSFLIPAATALGRASVIVTTANATYNNVITVTPSTSGVFTANANGMGPLAAQIVSVAPGGAQTYSNTATLAGTTFVNAPIAFSPAADSFYLLLYGTGFDAGKVVTVTINGTTYTPLYAGSQNGFAGLDQINILLPASLAGSGTVNVTITVDGQVSNTGTLAFQ